MVIYTVFKYIRTFPELLFSLHKPQQFVDYSVVVFLEWVLPSESPGQVFLIPCAGYFTSLAHPSDRRDQWLLEAKHIWCDFYIKNAPNNMELG